MQEVVLAVVVEEGSNRVLLVRRKEIVNGSFWAFPGGKREPSDTSDMTVAVREVHEETGIRCSAMQPNPIARRRVGGPGGPVVKYMYMRGWGEPKLGEPDKFHEVSWFPALEVLAKLQGKLLPKVRAELQKVAGQPL